MTGTPIRADKEPIPGFEQRLTDAEKLHLTKFKVVDSNPDLDEDEDDVSTKWLKIEKFSEYHFELVIFVFPRREAWQQRSYAVSKSF